LPQYPHHCLTCDHEFTDLYPVSRDPKETKCEKCGAETERLIGLSHFGWDRRILHTFIKGDDERAEAQQKDHMGPNPYGSTPDEMMM
jgi:putative FmdB family regulatory protein